MFTYTGFLESLVWTKHVTTIQTWKWKRTTTTNMAQFTGWFGRRHVVPIWKMSSQELRRPEHQFNNGKDVSLVISTKLGYIFLGNLSHISLPDSYRATISIGPIFFFRSVLGDFWCRRIPQNPLVVWSPDPSNGSGCINWSIKITGNKWTLK
jgi:hypothetical protein